MIEFVCDDREVEKILKKLYKLLVANGAIFHKQLTVVCIKGDIQVNIATEVPNGEKVIILPKQCLLPVDKYKLDLDEYKIIMLSHDEDLNEGQVAMMKMMIELFNLTGKIETQIKTSTYSLHYEDNDLFHRILKSRSKSGIPFLKKMDGMSKKSFYLKSFLNTRTLGVKEPSKAEKVKFIMPFVEFLNHHARATRFMPRYTEVSTPDIKQKNELTHISVVKSCLVDESNECHVCYAPLDAMDALINYNYTDKSSFFVRSVPINIDLPDGKGTLKIQSITWDSQHKNLPEQLKNLEFYIPQITVSIMKDIVNLNFLYIPSNEAPNAMRRVLALALSRFELNFEQSQMKEILQFIEKCIINENIDYFEELSEYLKLYKPKPAVKLIVANTKEVVKTQLNHIRNYKLMA